MPSVMSFFSAILASWISFAFSLALLPSSFNFFAESFLPPVRAMRTFALAMEVMFTIRILRSIFGGTVFFPGPVSDLKRQRILSQCFASADRRLDSCLFKGEIVGTVGVSVFVEDVVAAAVSGKSENFLSRETAIFVHCTPFCMIRSSSTI